jgi:hypothetical protein
LAGHVASMADRRRLYRLWVERPEGKIQLGRPRCRWENDIELDLHKVG